MAILEYISRAFAFRNTPTTVLLVAIYIAAFASVLITDELPAVPKHRRLQVEAAYADLQQITANPHPYNSHSNQLVQTYLLSRLESITHTSHFAHISVDTSSNLTFVPKSSIISNPIHVYFEGANILVKIDGHEPDLPGVLFSAHYDSVSTASGATDDGIGIVSMVQTVKHLVENRPRRTAVFNFNNGEEDGLHGARAFMEHPWSNLTSIFINLEGAASGGRPILFRATSLPPVQSFSNTRVARPHGNALSTDAFTRGLIRSSTDYDVYATSSGKSGGHMEGLDFAFYKKRAFYHTPYDVVPHLNGGERAISAMLDTCLGAGNALLNNRKIEFGTGGPDSVLGGRENVPVYFDLFGQILLMIPLSSMFIANIVSLVVGPLLVLLLEAVDIIVQHNRREKLVSQNNGPRQRTTGSQHLWQSFKSLQWIRELWKVSKFWIALIFTVGTQALLIFGYTQLNPYVIYSSPWMFITTCLTLAYFTLTATVSIPLPFTHQFQLPEQQKNTTLLQLYILTWVLLVLVTVADLGGGYFATIWNVLTWLGVVAGVLEGIFGAKGTEGDVRAFAVTEGTVERSDDEGGITVRFESPGEVQARESVQQHQEHRDEEASGSDSEETAAGATERTPLIRPNRVKLPALKKDDEGEDAGAVGWWIVQLVLTVPVPVVLLLHILVIVVGALPQTVADGSNPIIVYAALALLSVLTLLPLVPFAFKLQRTLSYLALIIFILTTLYTYLLTPPFTQISPLKIYFQQSVQVERVGSMGKFEVNATTILTGLTPYIGRDVIPLLPSSRGKDVVCAPSTITKRAAGLWDCKWNSSESEMLPRPYANSTVTFGVERAADKQEWKTNPWFDYSITSFPKNLTTRVRIQGKNTRACRVYLDDDLGSSVSGWRVRGPHGDGAITTRHGKDDPLEEIRLWSRTWDKEFVLDLVRKGTTREGNARIACEFAEYQSGTVGVPTEGGEARIPAVEEVFRFFPSWATVSKTSDGLAEVWERVRV